MRDPTVLDRHAANADRATERAHAVARGLLITGRASRSGAAPEVEFIRLERRSAAGSSYWIRRDGSEVRSGVSVATADRLQRGFIEKMERAGAN